MDATVDQDGTVALQLADPGGDIIAATADDASTPTAYSESTEYGAPRDPATAATGYGWLGAHQRSSNDLAGLVLMGVRLYDPGAGRFLSTDPVPGGNANTYTYPTDPINGYDLNGQWGFHWHSITHFVAKHWKAAVVTAAVVAVQFVPFVDVAADAFEAEEAGDALISGYTRHGLAQAIERDGHGVSPKAIVDAVRRPENSYSSVARRTTTYVGRDANVVLNRLFMNEGVVGA